MRVPRSTMLRRTVAVAAVAAACAIGVAVLVLARAEPKPTAAAEPTRTTPRPKPPPVSGGVATGDETITLPATDVTPSVDDLLAELKTANAAFTAPKSMDLGDTQEIALLVSRERSIQDLQADLDTAGPSEGEQIKASEAMEAQLAGIGFAIEPLTPALQLVAGKGETQWRWAVEATKSGEQRLHLTLSAVFDRNGKERPYTIRTFNRTLDVDVTLQDRLGGFVDENWQWLWATLLVPLVGWLLRQRRRKADDPPPSALQS